LCLCCRVRCGHLCAQATYYTPMQSRKAKKKKYRTVFHVLYACRHTDFRLFAVLRGARHYFVLSRCLRAQTPRKLTTGRGMKKKTQCIPSKGAIVVFWCAKSAACALCDDYSPFAHTPSNGISMHKRISNLVQHIECDALPRARLTHVPDIRWLWPTAARPDALPMQHRH